jgi:NADPH:quinone reductase-like Zn-dependent oxidoreductase
MKAVSYYEYGSPDVLKLEDREKPVPKENEILIRIYATTVTAVDSIFRNGKTFSARLATGVFKPKINIPGSDFAGEVEALGQNVSLFKVGDKVFGDSSIKSSTYAEYICLSETDPIIGIPSRSEFEEAAALPYGNLTALPFLRDNGKIKEGHKVLVLGASGAVGSSAVQLAAYFGAEVTGVCSSSNIELVESLGADRVIDYKTDDFTKTKETYDIVFDTVGKSSFNQCKDLLKEGGVYLTTVVGPVILLQMLMTSKSKKKAVIAFTGLRKKEEKLKDLSFIKSLVESGKLKPVIDKKYPLADVAEAHKYVDGGQKKGNVVLTIR